MPSLVRYVLDAKSSQFTVHVLSSGMVAPAAHSPKFAIRDFSGEALFVPETLERASLCLRIKTSSLELMDETDNRNRRDIERTLFRDVLESGVFPEISFESTQISANKLSGNRYRASVTGNLNLHGVTKAHSLVTQVVVGPDTLRAIGDFTLKQSHYGMKNPSFPGGTLRDGVKLAFYIIAQKKT